MIVVETGQVISGANSFVSVSSVTAFATLSGQLTAWNTAETNTEKEQAIYRAMRKILQLEPRFFGFRTSGEQTLPFPRQNLYVRGRLISSSAIPQEVKDAQCELAIEEAATAFSTIPDEVPTGGGIVEEDKSVKKIKKSIRYKDVKGRNVQPYRPRITALLRPFMQPIGYLESH